VGSGKVTLYYKLINLCLGSIYSDSLNYTKNYILNPAGNLEWALARNNGYTNLTMSKNRMNIKRI
jgi:hypothetical protein